MKIMADESFLNPSRRSYPYEGSRNNSGNKARVILIVIGIVILLSLVAFAVIATGGKGEGDLTPTPEQNTPTPTIQEEPTPTEEITPTVTPKASPTSGKGTPTPTSSNSKSIDKASGLDRADLKVAVQNGGGIAGAATKASNLLKGLGYDVVSSGNADNFDYEKTEISVKTTKKAFADLLKKDLADEYTIGSVTTNYTGTDADAIIIVGQE